MATNLAGTTIASTYSQLLHVSAGAELTGLRKKFKSNGGYSNGSRMITLGAGAKLAVYTYGASVANSTTWAEFSLLD